MSNNLEKEELKMWLSNPTTQKIALLLKKMKVMMSNDIVDNVIGKDNKSDVFKALGVCKGLQMVVDVLEINIQDSDELEAVLEYYVFDIYQPTTVNNEQDTKH